MSNRARAATLWNRRSVKSDLIPELVDAFHDVDVHANRPAPLSLCLGGPFIGRVKSDFGSEPRDRRGEVEIIDRRRFHQLHVAGWVHTGADRPDYIGPVAGINVVIDDDDEFRIGELPEI